MYIFMKKIIFYALIFSNFYSFSSGAEVEDEIQLALSAKKIQQLIYPKKISEEIFTPYAVLFLQNKDIASSCALIDKKNFANILELISPSDGQFGNCHQTLQEPIISYTGGKYYATYTYITEETRAELAHEYQVIQLTKNGFLKCKEDSAISDFIHKNIEEKKIKPSSAIMKAIKEIGCTEVKNH
jgi:predicted CopG family antitoxin